ncbi:hypothetical protein PV433_18630 [Paenibacillus sp. GYB004]
MVGDGTLVGITNAQGELETSALTVDVNQYELQAAKGTFFSPVMKFKVSKHAGTPTPYNISVTMGEDTTTSRAFTWHTDPGTSETVVEVAKNPISRILTRSSLEPENRRLFGIF